MFFHAEPPQTLMDSWLKRDTQIVLLETHRIASPRDLRATNPARDGPVHGRRGSGEGAPVKGYSSSSDLCATVGAF